MQLSPWTRTRAWTWLARGGLASLLAVGCGPGTGSGDAGADVPARPVHSLQVEGTPGGGMPAATLAGLLSMPVVVNGAAGPPLVVDTGAPFTLLAPELYPNGRVAPGVGSLSTLALDGVTLRDVPVIGATVLNGAFGMGGLLGGDVICQFATTFDYRARAIALDLRTVPPDVEQPGVALPFALEGGGVTTLGGATLAFPATRVPVTVTLEGVAHPFILDTGASAVTVRGAVYDALRGDGRGEVAIPVTTAAGMTFGHATRVRSVRVGGAEVTGLVVQSIGDGLITNLATEVRHPVDGLLGVSFLREFLVTVDYPGHAVRLQRYGTRAHVVDDYRRVGFALVTNGPAAPYRYAVLSVYPGTDAAAQGVVAGTGLVAVDGQATNALSVDAADLLLRGAVGTTHTVQLADGTRTLRVEELLPLP